MLLGWRNIIVASYRVKCFFVLPPKREFFFLLLLLSLMLPLLLQLRLLNALWLLLFSIFFFQRVLLDLYKYTRGPSISCVTGIGASYNAETVSGLSRVSWIVQLYVVLVIFFLFE